MKTGIISAVCLAAAISANAGDNEHPRMMVQYVDNNCSGSVEYMSKKHDDFYNNNIYDNQSLVFETDKLMFLVEQYNKTKNAVFYALRVLPQRNKVKKMLEAK